MSAECYTCGADLVYGEGGETFCEPCRLRGGISFLRSEYRQLRAAATRYLRAVKDYDLASLPNWQTYAEKDLAETALRAALAQEGDS